MCTKRGVIMDFIRIGDKTISFLKLYKQIEKILNMRSMGCSQQEVAEKLNIDRAFVSRLEGLGEIRKGGNIAFIGFPIKNKDEIKKLLNNMGVEYSLLMTQNERNRFVEEKTGAQLLNEIMAIAAEVRSYDIAIVACSDMRTGLIEALLDNEIITIDIGRSPLTSDVYLDPGRIEEIINQLRKG